MCINALYAYLNAVEYFVVNEQFKQINKHATNSDVGLETKNILVM